MDKQKLELNVNDTKALTAIVSKKEGAVNTMIEWSSSDPSVVIVDYQGNITAISEGVADITVKTIFGGFTAKCNVNVNDPVK